MYYSWLPEEPNTLCNVDINNPIQYTFASSTCRIGRSRTWIFMDQVNTAYDRKLPKSSVLVHGYMFRIYCYLVFYSFNLPIFWLFCSIIQISSYSIHDMCVHVPTADIQIISLLLFYGTQILVRIFLKKKRGFSIHYTFCLLLHLAGCNNNAS